MDKIIQTLILWNTSWTAGRTSGKQNNTWFAYKKVLLQSVSPSVSDFPLESSQNILEKRSPSTPRVTGLLVATSGRGPGAWPRGPTGDRLRAGLQGKQSSFMVWLEKWAPVGSPQEPGPAFHCWDGAGASMHRWQHPQEFLWATTAALCCCFCKRILIIWHPILNKIHFTWKKVFQYPWTVPP